jgi:cystathionine beta-lyase/cystathionine gamma-synthase
MPTFSNFETNAIHAGQDPDQLTGAVMLPIYQTSTYKQPGIGHSVEYEYSRTRNPTRTALERCMAKLENASGAHAFSSGMAAIDAVLHLLQPGDHVLAVDDLYGGTRRLFEQVYQKYGIEFSYASAINSAQFLKHAKNNTRLIWLETPTNPLLKLCNLKEISSQVHSALPNALICVDNTFATPYLQQPLNDGVDLVIHSTTKYLGGHSDLIGGVVVWRDETIGEKIGFIQNTLGAIPGPFDCFLTLRGIKTLPVRMDRHAENALTIARFLEQQPMIERVLYPGLPSHPQFDLANEQMRNGGGIISITLKKGAPSAVALVEAVELFLLAESLGGVESLIEIPARMTHMSVAHTPMAIDPALVRLSIGIEGIDDLLQDLTQALSKA